MLKHEATVPDITLSTGQSCLALVLGDTSGANCDAASGREPTEPHGTGHVQHRRSHKPGFNCLGIPTALLIPKLTRGYFCRRKFVEIFIAIYIDAKSSTRLLPYYKPMCIEIVRWFRFNGTVGEKIRRFAEILVTRRNYLLTKWCAPSHVHVLWRLVIVMSWSYSLTH